MNAESGLDGFPKTSFPSEEHLVNIAARWADKMSERLQRLIEINPKSAIALAKLGNGALAGGVFAEADHGAIHTQIAVLTLNRHPPMTVDWVIWAKLGQCWPCDQQNGRLCALGHAAVAKEFCTKSSERAIASGNLSAAPVGSDPGWDAHSALARKIAELTTVYDESHLVGGKIDVVKLGADGSIRWLARKDNCPAQP